MKKKKVKCWKLLKNTHKKVIFFFLILVCFSFISGVNAKNVEMYFFYGKTCPHCEKEQEFLDEMEEKYDDLVINRYEVWNNKKNAKLMQEYAKKLDIKVEGVPFTIVNDEYMFGYSKSSNERIEKMITDALEEKPDNKNDKIPDETNTVKTLPVLGKVDVKNISIPLLSIILGFVDGFNPCAMWVLLFLITMLIGMKDKKRMWILGIAFLFTSGFVYMLIMLSWLKIVVNIGFNTIFKYVIAAITLIGAIVNIRSFIKSCINDSSGGCTVVDSKKRTKTFDKIKKFTSEKSFILAILGVIGLAISVNLVELACSAGLPIIYTEILALNNIAGLKAFLYTLIYIFFFLIDDAIVFIIAMITLKVTGITTKYTKYSHLVGGILMLMMGILLIFKPEWLMFSF